MINETQIPTCCESEAVSHVNQRLFRAKKVFDLIVQATQGKKDYEPGIELLTDIANLFEYDKLEV